MRTGLGKGALYHPPGPFPFATLPAVLRKLILDHLGTQYTADAELLEEILADYPAEPLLDDIWRVLREPGLKVSIQAATLILGHPGRPESILVDMATHRLSVVRGGVQLGRVEWSGGVVRFWVMGKR